MNTDEREELTPLQAAMIEHDDDMARLDRNTSAAVRSDKEQTKPAEQQLDFWLNNYWPDWRKGNQDSVELMRAAWLAAMRLARFNELALKGAIDYTVEVETSISGAATRMREACVDAIKNLSTTRWVRMSGDEEASASDFQRDAIVALESLTLDQVEKKQ